MADDKGNGDGGGDPDEGEEETPAAPRAENLDALHEDIMSRQGEELSKPEGEEGEDPDEEEGPGEGDPDPDKDKEEDKSGDPDEEESEEDQPPPPDKTDKGEEEKELTPPEHDDDVTKPGKYKAKFVDEEGKEYFVEDMDQLPDDFEPRSQKDYGKSIFELGQKRSLAEKDQATYETAKAEKDRADTVKELRANWNSDIERLTKDKTLPEDPKEREKVIEGVYGLMASEMKKGKALNSWEYAHEIYQSRQAKKAAAAKNTEEEQRLKDEAAEKKKQGAKVMGSGSGGAPKKSTVRQAPPMGTTLDTVHQSTVGSV